MEADQVDLEAFIPNLSSLAKNIVAKYHLISKNEYILSWQSVQEIINEQPLTESNNQLSSSTKSVIKATVKLETESNFDNRLSSFETLFKTPADIILESEVEKWSKKNK